MNSNTFAAGEWAVDPRSTMGVKEFFPNMTLILTSMKNLNHAFKPPQAVFRVQPRMTKTDVRGSRVRGHAEMPSFNAAFGAGERVPQQDIPASCEENKHGERHGQPETDHGTAENLLVQATRLQDGAWVVVARCGTPGGTLIRITPQRRRTGVRYV
jgi:hypothetical protein